MSWLQKDRGLEAGFPNICSHYCDCSHLSLGQNPCFQLSPDTITLFFFRLAYGLFCDRYERTFLLNIIYIPSILVSAWDPGINCPQTLKDYCPSSHTFLQVMQTLPNSLLVEQQAELLEYYLGFSYWLSWTVKPLRSWVLTLRPVREAASEWTPNRLTVCNVSLAPKFP